MSEEEKFEKYYALLLEWNKKFNLTKITEKKDVELLHFKDSVLPQDFIGKGAELLDLGSGAGFPAIPLKIVRNDLNVTMVDSVGKKVNFLNEVIKSLGLSNTIALHSRIEEIGPKKYDAVTSRALAPLVVLCEYSLPYLKIGGIMLAYKSVDISEELKEATNAIRILGGEEPQIKEAALNEEIKRKFIIIKKIKETPQGYPRGGNKPRLKPLI